LSTADITGNIVILAAHIAAGDPTMFSYIYRLIGQEDRVDAFPGDRELKRAINLGVKRRPL